MCNAIISGKCLIVSPHLDDAVLSCGQLLAHHPGSVVVTVFAGVPSGARRLTWWDAASGFSNVAKAMAVRREEDRAALGVLKARPLWLDFHDRQYRAPAVPASAGIHTLPHLSDLMAALGEVLQQETPQTVCIPAGLGHPDHVRAHHAMLALRAHHLDKIWLMYEDALYRRRRGHLRQRLQHLQRQGVSVAPVVLSATGSMQLKKRALACYRSQLQALALLPRGYADAYAPERYWRLSKGAGPA
ncbi:MAG: PIG-L family deacetylase [Pseudomonadota bacterium]